MFRALGRDVALWDVDQARAAAVAGYLGATGGRRRSRPRSTSRHRRHRHPRQGDPLPRGHAADRPARLADGRRRPRQGRGGARGAPRADLFCDDWEQASHGGELAAGVAAGVVAPEHVTELGRVLAGQADGRRSAEDITLFDSTGLAIQDLAIAQVALAKADALDVPRLTLYLAPPRLPGYASRLSRRAGREVPQQRVVGARDRSGHELAAGEAEHVAVARVAARHPDVVEARDAADDREEVHHHARRCPPRRSRPAARARAGRSRTPAGPTARARSAARRR